jgi:hypothetical protein
MRSIPYAKLSGRPFLFALCATCLAIRLKYAYLRAIIPFQLDYEEGNILNTAVRLLHHQTLYPAQGSFPYVFNPYGPVGYVLAVVGVRLFGLSPFGPRFLVLIAGICIVLLIAVLIKNLGGQLHIGILLGALYLCSPLLWAWFPLLRVDLWALALSLLGLYLFSAFPEAWPLAAVVFASAILTKHTAVAAPLACALEFVILKEWKRALLFATILAVVITATIVSLDGNPIFHLLRTHPDPFGAHRLGRLYLEAAESSALALAILIYAIAAGARHSKRSRLAWNYFALSSFTVVTAGKLGSETNHFLEWAAALSMVSGCGLCYLIEIHDRWAKALVAGVIGFTVIFSVAPHYYEPVVSPDRSECSDAYAFVRSFPGRRILSEDVTALVVGERPVIVSNPYVATQLGNSVRWSRGSVEQLVDQGYFDLIVLGGDLENFRPESGRWSPALIEGVARRYQPARHFKCFPSAAVAYVPQAVSP